MSSFFNSIFKANPCICVYLSVSISPHPAVLKEFWSLVTLFCTRAIWKFSNSTDFSWENANLFKPQLLWKCNFSQVFQRGHISDSSQREILRPANFFASSSCSSLGAGGFNSLSGTVQGVRGPTLTWAVELSAETSLPLLPHLHLYSSYQKGFAFIRVYSPMKA